MDLKVEVANASLDDVIATVYEDIEDEGSPVTLGDAVMAALIDRLTRDPRWDGIAARFAEAVDAYFAQAAPHVIKAMVEQEVTRQLGDTSQGALTRGRPSTRAEAVVATEVTAQLRGQFAPVVERALRNLASDLQVRALEAVEAFQKGRPR